jgi:hypothetical protein
MSTAIGFMDLTPAYKEGALLPIEPGFFLLLKIGLLSYGLDEQV